MGSYHGDRSFETFTHERATMVKSTFGESLMAVRYPPYNDDKNMVLSMMTYGLPGSLGSKVKTFFRACAASIRVLTRKQPNV